MSADCKKVIQIVQGERKELNINILDDKGKAVDLTGVTEIQSVHELETEGGYLIKALEKAGVAEVTDITTAADVAKSLSSKYFLYNTPSNAYAFYFVVDAEGNQPSLSNTILIPVNIAENATADAVASALQTAMDAQADISASVSTNVVTSTNVATGAVDDASDLNTGFTIAVTTQGVTEVADSVEIIDVAGQIKVKLQASETENLKVENRQTVHLAIDFPTGRRIIKIKDAYDVCPTPFDLN